MEALVLIFAELLLPPIFALLIVIVEFLFAVVVGVGQLIFHLISGRKTAKSARTRPVNGEPHATTFGKNADKPHINLQAIGQWFKWIGVGTLTVTLLLLVVVNFFFIDPIARYAFTKVTEKTGIALNAERIDANLFTGTFDVSGITVSSQLQNKPKLTFDVGNVSGDLSITTLLSKQIKFASLAITDVSGTVDTPNKADAKARPTETNDKRLFAVNDLTVTNAAIDISKAGGEVIEFKIIRAQATPLRSNWALFDLLFRSNLAATIDGVPFNVTMENGNLGRITTWQGDGLPLASLNKLSGKAPLNWVTGGSVDINVADQWNRLDDTSIDLDWRIRLNNASMSAPSDAGVVSRALMTPIASYVNKRQEPVDLQFALILNPEKFEYAASLDATGIWDAVNEEIARQIALRFNREKDDVKTRMDNALDKVKGILSRDRETKRPTIEE